MSRSLVSLAFLLAAVGVGRAETDKLLLLQKPTVSKTQVAFVYGGDLWTVSRDGGDARRLTSDIGIETDPSFSPDGKLIAFTGEYDGNVDVYIVPSEGGVPRRLTYHPSPDQVVGWTPDGKNVLFRSTRASYSRFTRLYTVPIEGGLPKELPLPEAYAGSYSPDGSRIAYMPLPPAFLIWKHYRGGQATPIWIARLSDSSIEKIPRDTSNDFNPMWIGDKIYFISDRNGPMSLFAYDTASKEVTQVLPNDGLDLKSASAGPDAIVYEQFGSLHLFDPASGKEHALKVKVAGDLPGLRTRFEKVSKSIASAGISPTGVRAVFCARGEVLTVPADKGHARNLTNTPGVAERDPAWSPNGKWIAYLSDESGEYQLHLRDQRGEHAARKIALGDAPSFYYSPIWSPDSKKIAYTDKRLNLWYVDIDSGKSTKVDHDTYDAPERTLDPNWSSDSRWIAYTKRLKSHMRAVFIFDVEAGKTHQVTDGMSDAHNAVFDKNGKYLYFAASTDDGPTTGWLDMSSMNRQVTSSVYVVVLNKKLPSPLAPESDEETAKDETPLAQAEDAAAEKPAAKPAPAAASNAKKPKAAEHVRIDFEDIDQRILALPIPPRHYINLEAGKAGTVFLLEQPSGGGGRMGPPPGATVQKFDIAKRKADRVTDGVSYFAVSANGEKMLFRHADNWYITPTAAPPAPGQGMLKLDELEVRVDPMAEWKQMYHEVWRIERDFLYDPNAHGLDLKAAEAKYAPYLDGLAHRSDLNYLFGEMLGELTLGHTFVNGGDMPEVKHVPGGLLGADYVIDKDRYRFARVYRGQNWNPQARAPLTQPGVNVKEGEYLLAVNSKPLHAKDEIYQFFEGTADKSVVLKVGPNADGKDAREVTVVPIASETQLRNLNWIEDNRRKVDKLSDGRVAYVYLPDTSVGGYTNFNRYYFAQLGKEGAVIDERFNGGGTAADYIIDYMRRPLMNYWSTREGDDFTTPVGSIFGPKAMIINENAGSGGDAMPWYFRKAGIGRLVGKRTWGGLVGIYDYPQLIDGGRVTAPRVAFWRPEGSWDVENHGVDPDIEVEFDPQAVREGHDPQLERAVAVVLDELKKHPLAHGRKPAFPNYHKGQSQSGTSTGTSRPGPR
jgi:tricorn protease